MSPRPSYMAAPVEYYTCMFSDVDLNHFCKKDTPLRTYFPLVHTLWGPQYLGKQLHFFYHLITLWPYLLQWVTLAQTDTAITVLTIVKWCAILGNQYFHYKCWPPHKQKLYGSNVFFSHGGLKVFGSIVSIALVLGQLDDLTGTLDCGCEAEEDNLKGDSEILYAIAFRVVEETLLLDLLLMSS
ncbi:hypothetical protein OF83DRAFT_1180041 [Amylostereum chailletii]|nr:hypothetical protein OF83DRAFT_1180041 [Amylostereum chailletii]